MPLIAPWVNPAYSRVTAMQIAQYVPTKAFNLWHHIPRFFVTQAIPMLASSQTFFRQISSQGGGAVEENRSSLDANRQSVERDDDVLRAEMAELFRLALPFMYDESTVGANNEALLCLRKSDGSDWGVCSDYAQCAQMLAAREQSTDGRVSLRTYFAYKDALVGSRGARYFQECWKAPGVEAIDFISTTVDETDHDTLIQSFGVWEAIFTSIGGRQ